MMSEMKNSFSANDVRRGIGTGIETDPKTWKETGGTDGGKSREMVMEIETVLGRETGTETKTKLRTTLSCERLCPSILNSKIKDAGGGGEDIKGGTEDTGEGGLTGVFCGTGIRDWLQWIHNLLVCKLHRRQSSKESLCSEKDAKQLKDEIAEVTTEMENMEVPSEKSNPKSKHESMGRKKFNMDPKKGIEYLIEHGLMENTPEAVAAFLHKGEGLNKTAIGDYLGERNDFNIAVLKAFVQLHEFSDMILVQALRQFLWSFRLPGEAQKIDRMMVCFSDRYCETNPHVYTTTDTCYVLSFAIIMLNTSLHNPSVKDKPNVQRFIDMNRGINDGGDLPTDLLENIYDSIKKEPFKFPEDDGNDLMHTFFNPDKEGWLWKQGGRYRTWKRRWFILNDNCLYYFEFTTDKEPKGIIPLENIQVREVPDKSKPNCFELFTTNNDVIKACKTDADGKVVEGKHHVYRMSAASVEEKDDWIKSIRASISDNPFYNMLSARRKNAQAKVKK